MQLFHQTSKQAVPNILKEGLKISYSNLWRARGGCIYLSKGKTRFGEVVLSINIEGLDVSKVSDWEYICWEDIPPERIKII